MTTETKAPFVVTGNLLDFHIEADGVIWYRPFIKGELSEKKFYVDRPDAVAMVLERAIAQGYRP